MLHLPLILKALSDETRLRLIHVLMQGELCVCDLTEALALPQTRVSRHLAVLKHAGLVQDRKKAQWVYYSLIQDKLPDFVTSLIWKDLPNLPVCGEDSRRLTAWLQRKSTLCP